MTKDGINQKFVARRIREAIDMHAEGDIQLFAHYVGLSASAMYNYIHTERTPSTRALWKISRFTNLPMEWFLTEPKRQITNLSDN